jgi:hypothetical protein
MSDIRCFVNACADSSKYINGVEPQMKRKREEEEWCVKPTRASAGARNGGDVGFVTDNKPSKLSCSITG